MIIIKSFSVITVLILLLLSACGRSASDPPKTDSAILASTTFLADITQNIAGDRMAVDSLLPVGADPHSYQPAPQDIAKIASSKLLIINGLEYEHFLEALFQNTEGEREIIEASAGISARVEPEMENGIDPHMWLDPNLVITYVENIRAALTKFDPDGASTYQANADAYTAHLQELDSWIKSEVEQIPANRRLLVTNHEALGYFAERYGFTVVGAIIPSVSTDASPSAQQMADLIDLIKSSGAPAIFLGEVDNPVLAQQIATETGVKVVEDLTLESLTDGAPAPTYIDMIKHNVSRIVEAFK